MIANPLFGTTTAHMAALFTVWGDDRAKAFLDADAQERRADLFQQRRKRRSGSGGTFQFALVDSDDVHSRRKQGRPVEGVYPDQEEGGLGCFIVPNAVLLIKDGPHPKRARS